MSKLGMDWLVRSLAMAASAALFFAGCGSQTLGGGGGGTGGIISGSGGVPGAGGASSGLGGGGPIDCGTIEDLPAVFTIVDGVSGDPICDPTFAVERDASTAVQATAYQCLGATPFGCPAVPTTDGQPQPCVFIVYGSFVTGQSYTVAVSAPGYLTSQVAGVTGGQAATCGFPYEPPSQLTVALFKEH